MYESLRLIQEGSRAAGAINLGASLAGGLLAMGLGLWLGTAVAG